MNNMQYRPPMQLQTPEEKQMGMFIHLSSLVYAFFYPIGAALPIILWQTQKDQMPALDAHGKNATNWIISSFIYMAVSIPLMFVLIGFLIAPIIWVLMVVCISTFLLYGCVLLYLIYMQYSCHL